MKQIAKKWCPIVVALAAFCGFTGCSKNAAPLAATEFKTQQAAQAVVTGAQTLSRDAADTPVAFKRQDGTQVVVYQSLQRGQRQLVLTQSSDGTTWSSPKTITHQTFTATNPSLAESPSGELLLGYATNQNETWELYLTQSTDGVTWSEPRKLDLGIAQAQAPSLLWHQNQFSLVFQAMQGGIYLSTSSNGQDWSKAQTIAAKGEAPVLHYSNATHRYILLTEGESDEGWNLFVQTSKELSQWSKSQQLTRTTRARWGRLAANGNTDHLIYSVQQEEGSWNILAAKTTDWVKWSQPQALIQNGLRNASPNLLGNALIWSMGSSAGRNSSVVLSPVRL